MKDLEQSRPEAKQRYNIPALKEIIEERKEKAIEDLSGSYAKDRLPLEEYERLVEYINKIESERELAVVEKIVAEYHGNDEPNLAYREDDDDERYSEHGGANLAILSTRTVNGPIKSGSQLVSILGSQRINIRKQDLTRKQTVLSLFTLLGDSTVFVESGIRVVNKVIPILGSATTDYKVKRAAEGNVPELIISGAALLGDVKVKLLKE